MSERKDNMPILRAIKKYKAENFKIEILYRGIDNKDICEKEKKYIKTLNSNNPLIGYNLLEGGEGVKPTPELRKKLSERGKRLIGSKNPFYGKKHTEEAKKKMSLSRKGKIFTRKLTEEERKKMSEMMKKLRKDPLFNEKIKKARIYITGKGNKRNAPIKCIELNKNFESIKIAEIELNKLFNDKKFRAKNILQVCRGEKKTHCGFSFEYLDKNRINKKNNFMSKTMIKVKIVELNKIFNSKKECVEFLKKEFNEIYYEKYIKNNKKYKKYTFLFI